jgi:hypothetical protein
MKRVLWVLAAFALASCDTFTVPPYSATADNNLALKAALGDQHVAVGQFTMAAKPDDTCRGTGPIQLPGGMTFEGYLQKAFTDELKLAGLYDAQAPLTLTGRITDLRFTSMGSGTWDIALTLDSSNGKTLSATEHYDFHTSYTGNSACRNVAEAFQPAVQELVGKVAAAPDFRVLARK